MPDSSAFSRQYSRLGRYSRYAGLGFIALSVALLVLSAYDQFILFEIDSIAAFLIAVFLLFRDPRARVQAGVLDAILGSTDETIEGLSALSGVDFTYVPAGSGVEGVVIAVTGGPKRRQKANVGSDPAPPPRELIPPGRGLAMLFVREMGFRSITLDLLRDSLPDAMRERFSLATTTEFVSADDSVDVTLRGASTVCSCSPAAGEKPSPKGSVGCPVASFVAVLVSAATDRPVSLKPCARDGGRTEAWKISMALGAGTPTTRVPVVPEAAPLPATVSK